MDGAHSLGGGGSPTSGRPGTGNSYKRKRSGHEFESSPGSGVDVEEEEHDRRRLPGVKRACNECRQQKLRCDVVQDPFRTCSRCNRLKLECKIESNFKRVGKRSKHAEMEKQIERLQRNLQRAQAQGYQVDDEDEMESPLANGMYSRNTQSYMGSDEAVSSLIHLKQGGSYGNMPRITRQIDDVGLTEEQISLLFGQFWAYYHQYLPFLDPLQAPDSYYEQHPLLFWTIISIAARRYTADPNLLTALVGPLTRLLWNTVGEVPTNYFVVKALCLLCVWPLPTSTTTTDPTHILSGVMMKTATGIGLHRPSHTQDFSRVSIDLNREQLHDRVTTWAVCNIVAQSVGTGYGQPASTLYDWTLAIRPGQSDAFTLSPELEARLQVERFCDKVSKDMYSNATDPRGVAGDELRAMLTRVYRREYNELSVSILSRTDLSPIVQLYLKAAGLHLRLSAFFDSSTTVGYMDDLMGLWRAAVAFLDYVFEMENIDHSKGGVGILRYGTNYILQMTVAAGFTLLKLLGSFFAKEIEFDRGKQLFKRAIAGIRSMSIISNDLPWRLAELMVQMYNGARIEARSHQHTQHTGNGNGVDTVVNIDDSLQLKVRCRMSMSLMFDSIWRWREEFQAQGRGNIDSNINNPTNPDSANESSASSTTHLDSTLMPPSQQINSSLLAAARAVTPNNTGLPSSGLLGGGVGYTESNYEVFDPLNWMLDGLVDFPYSYAAVQGLEANGLG
ncbi:hypothetical protein B0O99DRAFT_619857 [Bisporella sp. PMI_857]|nr:hypothetical protein B0O99DRAFT_619857 [Bisporella sp. PMI_857]